MRSQFLIDSHAHVQFPAYDADREAVMRRALDVGIGVINIGTQYSTSEDAIRLAEQYPDGVWATVGFHPSHVYPVRDKTPEASAAPMARISNGADLNSHHDPWELREKSEEVFDYQKFIELARHPKVVAVGECGLDYYRIKNHESGIMERQREVFRQQIELAHEVRKPLVVHCRKAFADLIRVLSSLTSNFSPPGVVHFFSGSWADAEKLLSLGFYLSFGGVITFSRDYDEVIKMVPLERLLLETDAPYVAPIPYRGKRNEPAYITEVAKKIAELRGISFEETAMKTTGNAQRLFSL